MAYKLVTSSQTERDIVKAIEWYIEIKKSVAKKFLAELKAVRKYIHQNPEKIQVRYSNVRIAFLKKFPYGLHYTFENETVTIIALFSTAEDPNKWDER